MGHRHWTESKQDYGLISLQLANEDNDCDSGIMGSLDFCLMISKETAAAFCIRKAVT